MSELVAELVCRGCGCRVNAEGLRGRQPHSHPAGARGGFVVERVEVTFGGMCPVCREARDRRSL